MLQEGAQEDVNKRRRTRVRSRMQNFARIVWIRLYRELRDETVNLSLDRRIAKEIVELVPLGFQMCIVDSGAVRNA